MKYSTTQQNLPIYPLKEDLCQAISNNQILVIVGETGSGKTTQLPQYILNHFNSKELSICVTQPRRIAAITAAKRVAYERNSRVGQEIGYTVRFDDSTNNFTKLRFVTDGVLLREACSNTLFSKYQFIVIDEAHERTLDTDVLLGMLKSTTKKRADLKVLIMSATLNVEKFSDFFDKCPIFSIPGKLFNIDILHQQQKNSGMSSLKSTYLSKSIEAAIYIHFKEDEGDVLIFLTGKSEIDKAVYEIKNKIRKDEKNLSNRNIFFKANVHALYSTMDIYEQKHIFELTPKGFRKIVVATNIAQTSLTIPGIKYVIDCGFVKQKVYDHKIGMDALLVCPISRAAAIQRAGRAGRTSEGKVYRLYGKKAFETMDAETIPEIQRTSLLETVLDLKIMNIDKILEFDFIDKPNSKLIINALRKLFLLGALTRNGKVTELGKLMNKFPISPFLSKALIEASGNLRCSEEVLTIASMLSVEDVFVNSKNEDEYEEINYIKCKNFYSHHGDHISLLIIYNLYLENKRDEEWCKKHFLNYRNLKQVFKIRNQLEMIMNTNSLPIISIKSNSLNEANIIKAFCSSFFLNVARKHPRKHVFYHYAMSSVFNSEEDQDISNKVVETDSNLLALYLNSTSILTASPSLDEHTSMVSDLDWLIYNQLIYTTKALITCASKIDDDWVKPYFNLLHEIDDDLLCGNEQSKAVVITKIAKDINEDEHKINSMSENDKKSEIELAKQRFLKRKRKNN